MHKADCSIIVSRPSVCGVCANADGQVSCHILRDLTFPSMLIDVRVPCSKGMAQVTHASLSKPLWPQQPLAVCYQGHSPSLHAHRHVGPTMRPRQTLWKSCFLSCSPSASNLLLMSGWLPAKLFLSFFHVTPWSHDVTWYSNSVVALRVYRGCHTC